MYRVFTERLDQHRDEINRRLSKQLKSQFAALRTIVQGRARSWHVSDSLLSCMNEAYSLSLRARLNYWHQNLIAPDIGFPRVCSVFIPFPSGECARPIPRSHATFLWAAGGLLSDSPLMISFACTRCRPGPSYQPAIWRIIGHR